MKSILDYKMRSARVSEADLQRDVVQLAHRFRWHVFHCLPTQTIAGTHRTSVAYDGAGFPDLVLVRDRVLFVELKSAQGKTSAGQKAWAKWLEVADAEYRLWKPAQWLDGTIEEELR